MLVICVQYPGRRAPRGLLGAHRDTSIISEIDPMSRRELHDSHHGLAETLHSLQIQSRPGLPAYREVHVQRDGVQQVDHEPSDRPVFRSGLSARALSPPCGCSDTLTPLLQTVAHGLDLAQNSASEKVLLGEELAVQHAARHEL